MSYDHKTLLTTGAALIVVCGFYIATSGIPSTSISATLFPLSIMGLVCGILFILWGTGWLALGKFLK